MRRLISNRRQDPMRQIDQAAQPHGLLDLYASASLRTRAHWHQQGKGSVMAAELILEFEGITTTEYEAVNKALGIDTQSGKGDWPDGLVAHSAGLNDAGHLVVIEVWDTPEHQARFMEGRLGEALAKGGITGPPSSVTWIELVAHHYLGN